MVSGPVLFKIYLTIPGSFLYKNWGFVFREEKTNE